MARQFADSGDNMRIVTPTGMLVSDAWSWGCRLDTDGIVDSQGLWRLGASGSRGIRGELNFVDASNHRLRVVNEADSTGGNGTTSIPTGTSRRIGFTHNGSGSCPLILDGSVDATISLTDPTEIQAGDEFRYGFIVGGATHLRARIAWPFFLQGVQLSASALDDYLNQTGGKTICSLIDDYGVGGSIVADALKFLGPFQPGDPGEDISGVGNDLTDTGTVDIADPAGFPSSCAAALSIAVADYHYQQQGIM